MSELIINLFQAVPFLFLAILVFVMCNVALRMAGKSTKKTLRALKK